MHFRKQQQEKQFIYFMEIEMQLVEPKVERYFKASVI